VRGKAPALSPWRGRARCTSESPWGGRGGGFWPSVPGASPSSCIDSLSSCPGPRSSGGRGQTATLPSLLEGRARDVLSAAAGCGGCLPTLRVPTTPFVPDGSLVDPFAGLPLRQSDDIEVASLLEKGAIEEVPLRPPSLGFVINLFLVQKKNGKMRSASTSVS
jgi:hypothetical protein